MQGRKAGALRYSAGQQRQQSTLQLTIGPELHYTKVWQAQKG